MNKNDASILAELTPKIMNAFHDLGTHHPRDSNLTMRQYQTLIILSANKNLTLTQLCDKLNLAPSTGTELVNRMIALNFINKSTDTKNQRQVNLEIAHEGKQILTERQNILTKMFITFLKPFDPQDAEIFVTSFQAIWELIDKYYKNKNVK